MVEKDLQNVFNFQMITEKTLCSKDFTSNLRDISYEKEMIKVPTNFVTNLLLSIFVLLKKQKQELNFQQVVPKNFSYFVPAIMVIIF